MCILGSICVIGFGMIPNAKHGAVAYQPINIVKYRIQTCSEITLDRVLNETEWITNVEEKSS